MWFPQLSYFLTCGYRVIAPDMSGYGGTPFVRENYSVGSMSDDVMNLIKYLKIEKPVVVGISMGGYIALDICERNPELLGAIVLSNTKAEADTEDIKKRRQAQIEVLKQKGVREFVKESAPRRLSKKTLGEKPWVLDAITLLNMTVNLDVLIATLQAMLEKKDNTPSLSKIKIPTLITYGTDDQLIPKTAAPAMHKAISHSEIVPIEGTAHVSNLEDPAQYNIALKQFLSEAKF